MTVPKYFQAVVHDQESNESPVVGTVQSLHLPKGDVQVRVEWSSVNYKDALATNKKSRVARINPLVPGIDLSGEVVQSSSDEFMAGDPVVVHGYDLGVAWHGGYAEYASVPSEWIVSLPSSLSARESMVLGTAGFTAALSVLALENHGLEGGSGPILVTGATGGVGSVAVAMLAARGFEVVASTGKDDQGDWLEQLGADRVIGRMRAPSRPLDKETWAGVVDCTGGRSLANVLTQVRYGGTVAASGLTAGSELETTVFPFILRGVALIGIDSVQTPIALRRELWQRMAADLRPSNLELLGTREIELDEVPRVLKEPLTGQARGRTVVRLGGGRSG